jgi:hypothetical protein
MFRIPATKVSTISNNSCHPEGQDKQVPEIK